MQRLAFILIIGITFSNEVSASLFVDLTSQASAREGTGAFSLDQFDLKKENTIFAGYGEFEISQIDSTSKRLGAALIAIPLGMLGMHRIYLGTKPIVPIFYILTFGGGFGILPFIDFVVLIISDDVKPFIDNPRIFMWSNQ